MVPLNLGLMQGEESLRYRTERVSLKIFGAYSEILELEDAYVLAWYLVDNPAHYNFDLDKIKEFYFYKDLRQRHAGKILKLINNDGIVIFEEIIGQKHDI